MQKGRLKNTSVGLLIFFGTALISVWLFKTTTNHHPLIQPSGPISPTAAPASPVSISESEEPEPLDIFVEEDSLFHHGYEVRRMTKTIRDEHPGRHDEHLFAASYAVLKRNGRTVATFDGVYHPAGNNADFGLYDLHGDKSKQLIVSLTVPRGGRHWIISLNPKFRVLFDSSEWDVGREEISVIDLDNDGVYEICLPIVSYYGMDGLWSVGETPLPEIVFKYDPKKQRYLPANHLFVDFALRGLRREPEEETYKHHRFNVLLQYVYAGKENEGWASFDKYYPSPDNETMRARLKLRLKADPVYGCIYQNRKG